MAVRSVRGSGIGQVDTSSILPQSPSISEQLSRISAGQKPLPIQQGLGIDLSPVPGLAIPVSEVPMPKPVDPSIAGMPDESSGLDIFGQQPTGIPFTQGLIDLFSSGAAARGEDVQLGSISDAALLQSAQEEAAAAQANQAAQQAAAEAQREAGELTQKIESERAGRGIELGFTPTPTPKPEKPEASGAVEDTEDDPVKAATKTALDEYLKLARPGVKPEGYDQYIEEFQKATGLDVSGQPDKSTALMAFGLALMQNKAGKGFDVGEMLSAVGGAGEKALPELTKARAEARAIRAKAGEYALGRKKEDEAAAMNREQYYLIPRTKTGGPLGVVEAVTSGKGRFERLNAYELNNLVTNEDFNREYDIVKADAYNDIVKEAMKAPEVKDLYQTGKDYVHLFGDSKDGSSARLTVQLPDLNNPQARGMKPGVIAGAQDAVQYVQDMERDLAKQKEFFGGIADLLQQTDISAPQQARSAIVQGLRNLGFDAGGGSDPVKQIQVMLTELKAKNAAKILGESGKTLSDNDRLMVAEIVGSISFTEGDEALLIQKLGRLYDAVVGKAESNLRSAYSTLDNYGIQYSRPSSQPAGMTETGEDSEGRKKYKLD